MALDYTKKVLEEFKHPKNVGEIKNPDAKATIGSPVCGDMIKLTMKVDPKTHVIEDIKFKSYGCASNIATASMITQLAKGKTIEEAKKIKWNDAAKELGGLPNVKMHCSVLATNSIVEAVKDYERKHGLGQGKDFKLTPKSVEDELKNVINPDIGINIIRLKMVKDIKVKDGNVSVVISMGNTDEMYEKNIKEEVAEHLENLPGVKSVEVEVKK